MYSLAVAADHFYMFLNCKQRSNNGLTHVSTTLYWKEILSKNTYWTNNLLGGETISMRNGAAVVIALHQYSLTLKMRAVCTSNRLDCKVITFASGQSSFNGTVEIDGRIFRRSRQTFDVMSKIIACKEWRSAHVTCKILVLQ